MPSPFHRLLEPGSIGEMKLKNRIVMPPMGTGQASPEGYVTERLRDYYEERARGGVGLIIVESACVDSVGGKAVRWQLAIDDDRFLPGLKELAAAIHRHGAKAAIQLFHSGGYARSEVTGLQSVTPSATFGLSFHGKPPRELTPAEIEELVNQFIKAAERAQKAGFDGVEIHAAHAFLVAQFLSAAYNRRQDSYGGDLKGRARFLLEIIQGIKTSLGYPVWYRCDGAEYKTRDGLTLDQSREIARLAEEAGADAVHVSGPHSAYASAWIVGGEALPPPAHPPGFLVHLAQGIKEAVNIPVIAVGRITPHLGESLLREGKADLVAMGRSLIADPMLPQKLATGRLEDITPCIVCLMCRDQILSGGSIGCSVNAATGREREFAIAPASKAKAVMVVGGGPGGMEAARVARLRGHRVTLYEREPTLGGQLLLASLPPYKQVIQDLTSYLAGQMTKLGVRVEMGTEVTPELIADAKPDAVVVATGSGPFSPEIPGIEGENVVTAESVLRDKAQVGDRVVVIGGELVGCETAEFLAERGRRVTVTRRGPEMAVKVSPSLRPLLLERLARRGVTLVTGVEYHQITKAGLTIITEGGEVQTLEADTIVLAAGARPRRGLLEAIKNQAYKIYPVGDCAQPRRIADAIEEGARAGLAIC